MKRFRLILEGQNFIMDMGEGENNYGFYTTRFVKAPDLGAAEQLAVDLIRNDESLKSNVRNEQDDPPKIILNDHAEIGWLEFVRRQPGVGYTFYPTDSQEEWQLITPDKMTLEQYPCGVCAGDIVSLKDDLQYRNHKGEPEGSVRTAGEDAMVLTGNHDEPDVVWIRWRDGERETWDETILDTFKITGRVS